ncbi:ADAMTS-like protein 2 [Sarcophilus harrisii]|uniref:ADAMTS-like protein 2 n=1 Tax=Sarcophilus harrisii TaxID=9305 RepID=UPI001301DB9D|nr:ADAMTS-like protein 2 [Sarcophilus harrisii]
MAACLPPASLRRRLLLLSLLVLSGTGLSRASAAALRAKDSSGASEGTIAWDEDVLKWWGEWSSWSTCSRTCGGGVMSRERHCLQQRLLTSQGTSSIMCTGHSKDYHLCHQQPCPANSDSFKQQQCAIFNGKAFGKHHYHWIPLYPDDYISISNRPCDLQCTTKSGERQLMVQAQDGTSCKDRMYQGVCINGQCEPVGCDGGLHSFQTMDRCRVCGGDGSTCYRVSGSFRKGISQLGYVFITNIPAGATDILIIERRKTENILALADDAGHFFFNGNAAVDPPQNFRMAGTVFKYRRPPSLHSEGLEYIIAQGPTNQSLNAMYYNFNGKVPHISYDFTVPKVQVLALHTNASAPESPLSLHGPHAYGHQNQDFDSPKTGPTADFNTTWISAIAPGEVNSHISRGGDTRKISLGHRDIIHRNAATVHIEGWGQSMGPEEEKLHFQVEQAYPTTRAGEAEMAPVGGKADLDFQWSQVSTSTAIPYPIVSPGILERGRAGMTQLHIFWKLCHRDSRRSAFCRKLQQLSTPVRGRSPTLEPLIQPAKGWQEGLPQIPTSKAFLEDLLKAEAVGKPEKKERIIFASPTMAAAKQNPTTDSSFQVGLGLEFQAEALQSPAMESNDFNVSPPGHEDISRADMYRWKVSAQAPCSSTCNSGISASYAMCVRYDGVEVEEAYCDAVTRPEPAYELCTGRDCQPRWETSRWSECSRTCGEGQQARTVRCWRMLAPGFDSSVYDELCVAAGLTRPVEKKPCRSKACGPQWELSEWSECSARCGGQGTMRREVRCSLGPSLCNESTRPVGEKDCLGPPCDRQWTVSDWGPCSGACGEGRMSRIISCRNLEGKVISGSQCDLATKPLAVYPCGGWNCPAHWVEQAWEQCNVSCGRGIKVRRVLCAGLENGVYREYPEGHCDVSQKPEVQAPCFKRPCSTWFTTTWSQCSKTCGVGLKLREVKCYQGEELGQGCDPNSKPESKQTCQVQPCPTEAPDEDCEDKATANCALVLRVKLCTHWYYRKACCGACRGKAL